MSKFYQFNSKYQDTTFYMTVTGPHARRTHGRLKNRAFSKIRQMTYEDLLYKYYEYKEGLEDARAQADRWRHQ